MPIPFRYEYDEKTKETVIKTSVTGKTLMSTTQLNKGSAFTMQERLTFGLVGKLPTQIEMLAQQTDRAYSQFKAYISDLQRHIFLNNLHDTNQVLFYNLVNEHLTDMMPLIYTPHVGTVVQTFSEQFRQARGLFISYEDRQHISQILDNRTNPDIDLIVVTDGEAVLGIGDQGVGAINIPIAKLMVYTLCGGVNPTRTLPIMLDVGTDNQRLLDDPLYLGWRHHRIRGEEYKVFIEDFIDEISKKFPKALLHWEDFSNRNAHANLALCKNKINSFNDDTQGTGCVTLATLLAAAKTLNTKISDHRFLIYGAGSAGTGIAHHIYMGLKYAGLTEQQAKDAIWLIDRFGLITDDQANLTEQQQFFAKSATSTKDWIRNNEGYVTLKETIPYLKPTVLIGCSSVANAFDEETIRLMQKYQPRPIIMPLSNPNNNAEARPEDIIRWTDGKALIATGSPFPPVNYHDQSYAIAQCNNSVIFPGIGLGSLAVKPTAISEKMLLAASHALAECAPALHTQGAALLPAITDAREVSKKVAYALAKTAIEEGLAEPVVSIEDAIDKIRWQPRYYPLQKIVG